MKNIAYRWASNNDNFKDVDVLGIFVDNHLNSRFLSTNSDQRLFKSALAFSLTARGIPFFYYGSEQGFAGGDDPFNREVMYRDFDRTSDLFKFIQTLNKARHAHGSYNSPFAEKWVDDQIYAFTRGKLVVGLTNNVYGQVHADIPTTEFRDGDILCNIFFATDCVTIKNGQLSLYLNNGEVKVYVPKVSTFWADYP